MLVVVAMTTSIFVACGTDDVETTTSEPAEATPTATISSPRPATATPSPTPDAAATPSSPGCARLHLIDPEGWELRESIDYPTDLGEFADIAPNLDWYSEYERFEPIGNETVESFYLSIWGLTADTATVIAESPSAAASPNGFEEIDADGRTMLTTTIPEVPAEVVVLIDAGDDYSLQLFSNGMNPTELQQLALTARPVCEDEWLRAGGVVLDCSPFDPDCRPTEEGD